MSNILWYQPEKLSDSDVVILNGNHLPNGIERDNAFSKLKKVADKAIGKKRPWQGYIDNYYFVKGSLDKLDERGRPLSFMFISDSDNGETKLRDTLRGVGIGLSLDTSNLLKKKVIRGTGKKAILFTLLLLCIVVLIYILSNKYGK